MLSLTLRYVGLLMFFGIQAQSNSSLRKYMEAVRNGSYDAVPKEILQTNNPEQVLQELLVYEKDSVSKMRSRAYNIAKRIGTATTNASARQMAISQLLKGIADHDSGISGYCSSGLTDFAPSDFSQPNKNLLISYLTPQTAHLDQVILLTGYLQLDQTKSKLSNLLTQNIATRDKWSVQLALARMGDASSIHYITTKLTQAKVNDDFVYEIVPDLIYTRNAEVFNFLEEIIMSNDADCMSANPNSDAKILCGYRVMEYLAYAIQDFPIATDQYHEAEISDYKQALTEVRNWFTQNTIYDFNMDVY